MSDAVLAFILLLIGYVLLAVEAFVIPGFGVMGLGGLALLGSGCWLLWSIYGWIVGLATVFVSLTITVVGFFVLARSRAGRRMILDDESVGESTDREGMEQMVGARGEALTDLRPSGSALFGAERLQVMTDGEYVNRGTPVVVVRVGTNTLVVAEALAADEG